MLPILEFIGTQWIEFTLLAAIIVWLIIYLTNNSKKIQIQPFIRFGKFNILSMALVRTGWGLKKMDLWAQKYGEWVKLFGLASIGVGFIGIVANIWLIIDIVKNLIVSPATQQVSLVVPFTTIPGLGYLAFSHWIIAIFILATVHEFAHGIVARAHNIPVNSSGFAVLQIFSIPIVPAAFVEPDEKKFPQRSDVEQYSVLAAGPVSNILLAIPFLLLYLFLFSPLTTTLTEPTGFSFATIVNASPAALVNVTSGTTYNYVNGQLTNSSDIFLRDLWYGTKPGDILTIGVYNYTSQQLITQLQITTNASPDDATKAFIGVAGITDMRNFKPENKPYEALFNWFKDLTRICFTFNLLIGLFNLMPLFITDGGQIVKVFANKLYPKDKKKAARVHTLVCSICLYALLAAFIIPFIFKLF